jgi:ABC-type methionine transport system ATPase subunit
MTREAKIRGYKPGRFSFNVKGGRCEHCQGQGTKKIEMHFLPDVFVTCQECKGSRYNPETLQITYKGKNIAHVLDMRIEDAKKFFANFPKIVRLIKALCDVGLGYMTLGQSSTTLSGGEAQRVKLASELGKPGTGHTLYILDEPTTGLHFADIHNLMNVLRRLTDLGNTIIVIEHNLDVIKMADYIIDLGPEGSRWPTISSTWVPKAATLAAKLSPRARRKRSSRIQKATPPTTSKRNSAQKRKKGLPRRIRIDLFTRDLGSSFLLRMVEDHLLDFNAFDGVELVHQSGCVGSVVGHFQQEQAVRRAETFIGFVQAQAGADAAAVLGQQVLHRIDMANTVGNVNAQNNVL